LARRCQRTVAISQVVRRHIIEATVDCADQITVVYNGIAGDDFAPEWPGHQIKRELGLATDTPVVVTVGQLVPWKRHDLFVEAARIIGQARAEVRFWIVGADMFGEHRRYVQDLKSSAPGSVRFLGYRTVVHCSTCEPFGRAILEAMSLGRPCVAPRAGGVAELIDHGSSGLLVKPADAAALAEGTLRLLDDQQLASQLGEGAQQRVRTVFAAQGTARQIQQVYEELVKEEQK